MTENEGKPNWKKLEEKWKKEREQKEKQKFVEWREKFDKGLKELQEIIKPSVQELAEIETAATKTDDLPKVMMASTGEKRGRNDSLNKIEYGDTETERIQEIYLQGKGAEKKGWIRKVTIPPTVELVVNFLVNEPEKVAAPWSGEMRASFKSCQWRFQFYTDIQRKPTAVGDSILAGKKFDSDNVWRYHDFHAIHPPKEGKKDRRGEDVYDDSALKILNLTIEILRAFQTKQQIKQQ